MQISPNNPNNEVEPISNSNVSEQLKTEPKFEVVNTKIMKYGNFVMRAFGFYHCKSDKLILKVYPIITLIIVWFNTIRTISCFNFFYNESESFSAELAIKIVSILWLFSCSINITIIFINQLINSREEELIKSINSLLKENEDLNDIVRKSSRCVKIIFTLSLVVGFFNVIVFMVTMLGPKEFRALFIVFLAPFHKTEWAVNSIPYKLYSSLLFVFTSLGWTLNVAYYVSQCQIIMEIQKNFNKRMSKFIENNVIIPNCDIETAHLSRSYPNDSNESQSFAVEADFEELRVYHLKICNVIKVMDKCYNQFIALTLLCYIPLVCIILYVVADWTNNCITGLKAVMFPFWLAVGLLIIVIIVNYGARINTLVNILLCFMENFSSFIYF